MNKKDQKKAKNETVDTKKEKAKVEQPISAAEKKKMKRSHRFYMILTSVIIIAVIAICIFVYNLQGGLVKIDFDEYLELNQSESRKLIYVGDIKSFELKFPFFKYILFSIYIPPFIFLKIFLNLKMKIIYFLFLLYYILKHYFHIYINIL